MTDDLRERVALERKLRYKSDRAAATAGGVANTTWSRWMNGDDLTDGMRQAVAKAFNWPPDWPENPPPTPLACGDTGGATAEAMTAGLQYLRRIEDRQRLLLEHLHLADPHPDPVDVGQAESQRATPPRGRPRRSAVAGD